MEPADSTPFIGDRPMGFDYEKQPARPKLPKEEDPVALTAHWCDTMPLYLCGALLAPVIGIPSGMVVWYTAGCAAVVTARHGESVLLAAQYLAKAPGVAFHDYKSDTQATNQDRLRQAGVVAGMLTAVGFLWPAAHAAFIIPTSVFAAMAMRLSHVPIHCIAGGTATLGSVSWLWASVWVAAAAACAALLLADRNAATDGVFMTWDAKADFGRRRWVPASGFFDRYFAELVGAPAPEEPTAWEAVADACSPQVQRLARLFNNRVTWVVEAGEKVRKKENITLIKMPGGDATTVDQLVNAAAYRCVPGRAAAFAVDASHPDALAKALMAHMSHFALEDFDTMRRERHEKNAESSPPEPWKWVAPTSEEVTAYTCTIFKHLAMSRPLKSLPLLVLRDFGAGCEDVKEFSRLLTAVREMDHCSLVVTMPEKLPAALGAQDAEGAVAEMLRAAQSSLRDPDVCVAAVRGAVFREPAVA